MECRRTGLRGGVAEAAEMGGLTLLAVSRPQRQAYGERSRGRDPRAEGRTRWGDRSGGPEPGAKPDRPWADRRVPDLPAPRRAWSRQAVFRRASAAAPTGGP